MNRLSDSYPSTLYVQTTNASTESKESIIISYRSSKIISVYVRGKLLSFFPTTAVFRYNDKQKTSSVSYEVVRDDKQW